MSLFGNSDGKTVAGSVTVTAANTTVVGSGTTLTNFEVGDFLNVGGNEYVFTAIANATVATVVSATGSAIAGASSNSAYVVSEKPLSIVYAENADARNVYGVSTDEMAYANTAGTEADNVTHAGWNRRTEGTGGRAGRVFYETLVASSSITGDAADDSKLPE